MAMLYTATTSVSPSHSKSRASLSLHERIDLLEDGKCQASFLWALVVDRYNSEASLVVPISAKNVSYFGDHYNGPQALEELTRRKKCF